MPGICYFNCARLLRTRLFLVRWGHFMVSAEKAQQGSRAPDCLHSLPPRGQSRTTLGGGDNCSREATPRVSSPGARRLTRDSGVVRVREFPSGKVLSSRKELRDFFILKLNRLRF